MSRRRAEQSARGKNPRGMLLATIFAAAETRITGILRDVFRRDKRQRELAESHRLVRVELASLDNQTPDIARALIESAFDAGGKHAGGEIGDRRGAIRSGLATKSATILADNLISDLGQATTAVGRRVDDIFRREGLRAALRQLETELPPDAAADLLVRRLEREGVTAFVDRRGRHWRLETYARMVIRTVAAEAVAQGTAQTIAARGYDLARVSEHHCNHHPKDPENPCRVLEGRVVSLTGRTAGFPEIPSLPPWHPNCTHVIAPAKENFTEVPELVAV